MRGRQLAAASLFVAALLGAEFAFAQNFGGPSAAEFLRAEWTVDPARAGRANVVGYLYNTNIYDAANVRLRVERLSVDGQVRDAYRGRVVGDVLSDGRLAFSVPVPEVGATYRVVVESVDWVKECR